MTTEKKPMEKYEDDLGNLIIEINTNKPTLCSTRTVYRCFWCGQSETTDKDKLKAFDNLVEYLERELKSFKEAVAHNRAFSENLTFAIQTHHNALNEAYKLLDTLYKRHGLKAPGEKDDDDDDNTYLLLEEQDNMPIIPKHQKLAAKEVSKNYGSIQLPPVPLQQRRSQLIGPKAQARILLNSINTKIQNLIAQLDDFIQEDKAWSKGLRVKYFAYSIFSAVKQKECEIELILDKNDGQSELKFSQDEISQYSKRLKADGKNVAIFPIGSKSEWMFMIVDYRLTPYVPNIYLADPQKKSICETNMNLDDLEDIAKPPIKRPSRKSDLYRDYQTYVRKAYEILNKYHLDNQTIKTKLGKVFALFLFHTKIIDKRLHERYETQKKLYHGWLKSGIEMHIASPKINLGFNSIAKNSRDARNNTTWFENIISDFLNKKYTLYKALESQSDSKNEDQDKIFLDLANNAFLNARNDMPQKARKMRAKTRLVISEKTAAEVNKLLNDISPTQLDDLQSPAQRFRFAR